jgi:hypothetical protein
MNAYQSIKIHSRHRKGETENTGGMKLNRKYELIRNTKLQHNKFSTQHRSEPYCLPLPTNRHNISENPVLQHE